MDHTSVDARAKPATVPARVQDAFTRGVGLTADDAAKTSAGWPSDVHAVRYSSMTRAAALKYVDGSTTDSDQKVVVVQLEGNFAVTTSGPHNTVATGTTETIVVDAATGNVIDFGLTMSPVLLPNPVVVFG